jgi:hypothetical protein
MGMTPKAEGGRGDCRGIISYSHQKSEESIVNDKR